MLQALFLAAAILAPDTSTDTSAADALTLEPAWTVALDAWKSGEGILDVYAVSDILLVEDARHRITALDRATGDARWVIRLDDRLAETPGFAAGRVTLTTHDRVLVVDELSGEHVYEQYLSTETAASPVAGEFLIFEPSLHESTLYTRRLQGGQRAWRYRIQSDFLGQALFIPDLPDSLLVVPCTDGKLLAIPATLDMPTDLRWSLDVGTPVGLLAQQDGMLVLASSRRSVVAIDTASGAIKWKAGVGAKPLDGPILVGDLVMVGTADGLVALRIADGSLAWRTDIAEVPLAGVPGLVVSRRPSGQILGRSTSDGTLREVPFGQHVLSSGPFLVLWRDGRSISASKSTLQPKSSVH